MISQSRHIVCHRKNNRFRIKLIAALRVDVDTVILIPANPRCCAFPLDDNGFLKEEALVSIQATSDFTYMNVESICELLNDLREEARKKGNLVKPVMLGTTTEYIVEIFDPYFADGKKIDASIFASL